MAKQTVVGYPLTPDLLQELDLLQSFPQTPDDFDPNSTWTNTYRIMTCHGYRESGNDDRGYLKLTRTPTGETFQLTVDQKIVNREASLHLYHAEITCLNTPCASPTAWTLSCRFVGPDGRSRTELDLDETGQIDGDIVQIQTNGIERTCEGQITGDWCLFEAVQRLPFETADPIAFDLLEGLSTLKTDHRLSYRGPDAGLHQFYQIGHGVFPYEYWLDEGHRLLMVATGARAYILDEDAESRTAVEEESGKRRYARLKQSAQ